MEEIEKLYLTIWHDFFALDWKKEKEKKSGKRVDFCFSAGKGSVGWIFLRTSRKKLLLEFWIRVEVLSFL